MKTLLLIIPLSISLSAFGQIRMSGSKGGGTVKNAPTPSHRPVVATPKPTSSSNVNLRPIRKRPASNSPNVSHSSRSSSYSNSSSSSSSTNTNSSSSNNTVYTVYESPNLYSFSNPAPARLMHSFERLSNETGGQFVISSPDRLARTMVDIIDQYAGDSADILIMIDVSGSMQNNVNEIVSESDLIIVSAPTGSRIGAASFRYSGQYSWFKHSDLDEDHWKAFDFISTKRKYMSSESHYDAIVQGVDQSSWKHNKRMIITITDEFIEPRENKHTAGSAIQSANDNNVELHTIMLMN